MKTLAYSLLLSVLLTGCFPDDHHIDFDPSAIDSCYYIGCDTVPVSKLKILWQVPLHLDIVRCFSNNPLIINDMVLFSQKYCEDKEVLTMLQANSGQRLWEWSGQKNGQASTRIGLGTASFDDKITYDSQSELFSIDATTGQTIWYHPTAPDCGSPRSSAYAVTCTTCLKAVALPISFLP